MNAAFDSDGYAAGLIDGELSEADLHNLDPAQCAAVITALLKNSAGRRWLRRSTLLNRHLADRLLEYSEEFSRQRYDATLAAVVELASIDALIDRAVAIAAGSGAPALWSRLAKHPEHFRRAFEAVIGSDDQRALEATATHLLLDPTEAYGQSAKDRREIAAALLDSSSDAARGSAAEFLAASAPAALATGVETLVRDASARVRGFAWLAAFRADRSAAADLARELLGDETAAIEIRLSALNAAGENLPTEHMIGLLSYFVIHPNADLALDAARLLHRHHRHPEIAIAAAGSPHEEVREIANRLMDPYRGSPAAGGSRPGDPLRADPLMQLLRQLEEEETEK